MRYINTLILFCFFFSLSSPAYAYLDDLDELLSSYVTPVQEEEISFNGVDYDTWSTDKRHARVRKEIQRMDLKTLKTDEQKKAFWLNAYNFFIIDLIIQKGERDSIQDLSGKKEVWDRYQWSVDGDIYTLNDIQKKMLQPLNDPRFHFALSCAAKSCPDIRAEAYRPEKVNAQLLSQTKQFLSNETKGFLPIKKGNILRLNKILEWNKQDFNKGNVRSWLHPYVPLFINAKTKIEFFDFDWALNSQ